MPDAAGEQARSKKRSLDLTSQASLKPYYTKGCVGPGEISAKSTIDATDIYTETMHINFAWIVAHEMQEEQGIPRLSGFVSMTGYMPKQLTTIGYYAMINSPITDPVTIQECLGQCEVATNEVGQAYFNNIRLGRMHESISYCMEST